MGKRKRKDVSVGRRSEVCIGCSKVVSAKRGSVGGAPGGGRVWCVCSYAGKVVSGRVANDGASSSSLGVELKFNYVTLPLVSIAFPTRFGSTGWVRPVRIYSGLGRSCETMVGPGACF